MTENIKHKLAKSNAVITLSIEEKIRELLEEFGWYAVHSSYYKDFETKKYRELDVVANKRWRKYINERQEIFLHLSLLIECKSMDGFHVVFSKARSRPLQFQGTDLCSWIGQISDKERKLIIETLSDNHYKPKEISQSLFKFEEIAYPDNGCRVFDLLVNPYPEIFCATSFRETNIGTEKDIENSVIWRAMQVVYSVAKSLKTKDFNSFISSLSIEAMLAEANEYDRINSLYSTIDAGTSNVSLFHPIVITNAELWINEEKGLERVDWCRLYQHNSRGEVERWCDIVNSSGIDGYFRGVTDHYNSEAESIPTSEMKFFV
jgi:hypothetical protein